MPLIVRMFHPAFFGFSDDYIGSSYDKNHTSFLAVIFPRTNLLSQMFKILARAIHTHSHLKPMITIPLKSFSFIMKYAKQSLIALVFLVVFLPVLAALPTFPDETETERDARMEWWRDAKYGMFIHWGASAELLGKWEGRPRGDGYNILRGVKMPISDYAEALSHFNPVDYDPEEWVLLAKEAGMKYIIFIAKHHDGFALWDTQASEFDIIDHTDYDRDILKELAEACAKYDMKLGVYYSHSRDWYHPGGAIAGSDKRWDEAQNGDFNEYLKTVAEPQVRELLTNYGPIAVMWWDMPEDITLEQAERLNALMSLQPGIIANDRLISGSGDFDTPERYIPSFRDPPDRDIEACMTIGKYWVYSETDREWKSEQQLLRNLLNSVGRGGNLLLNVTPDEKGNIIPENTERLLVIGTWLDQYGQSVYGTRQGPFRHWPAGSATVKGNTLYLHVYDWPNDGSLHVPIGNVPLEVSSLGKSGQSLSFESTPDGLLIDVPREPLEPMVSVLAVELSEPAIAIRQGYLPDDEGVYDLTPRIGERRGAWIHIEDNAIVRWTNSTYRMNWPMYVEEPGTYRVEAVYSCSPKLAGDTYQVKIGECIFNAVFQPAESFESFTIGTIDFDNAETVEVELSLPKIMNAGDARFHAVRLVPELTIEK